MCNRLLCDAIRARGGNTEVTGVQDAKFMRDTEGRTVSHALSNGETKRDALPHSLLLLSDLVFSLNHQKS